MKNYIIGDFIKFRDIDYNNKKRIISSGYILHIKQDGSFIVGNVFVPFSNIMQCLSNHKHPLTQITLVISSELL